MSDDVKKLLKASKSEQDIRSIYEAHKDEITASEVETAFGSASDNSNVMILYVLKQCLAS